MSLTLCVRPEGTSAEVRMEGEIDACVADRLQDLLLRITRAHGPRLLLDLSAVSFMDCAGLRALVLTLRNAEQRGCSVHLTAASPMVMKIITFIGAEDALPVRNQGRSNSSGTSSQAEEKTYCLADPPVGGTGHLPRMRTCAGSYRNLTVVGYLYEETAGPDPRWRTPGFRNQSAPAQPPDRGMWPTGSRESMAEANAVRQRAKAVWVPNPSGASGIRLALTGAGRRRPP